MSINTHSANFPTREQRLGSITGYEGTASDICNKSKNAMLENQESPFTQCTHCSSFPANYLLSLVQDVAIVNHAPLGCTGDFSGTNFTKRTGLYARGWQLSNVNTISTNLRENDMVFGGSEKLREAVLEASRRFKPKAIFVTTSCASAIIGENIDAVLQELENQIHIPIVPIQCEGFRSKIWATGSDAAFHGILHKIVKPPTKKRDNLINVLNITGWSEQSTLSSLLEQLGLESNFIIPFATVEQLESLSEAAATVHICKTLGTYLAAGLEEHFGVPEVKSPAPYGLAGTDTWLRALGQVVGKEKEVEELIKKEKEKIGPTLTELRSKLSGLKAVVSSGGVHGHGIINILHDLNIEVLHGNIYHHDPHFDDNDIGPSSLAHSVENYGDINYSVCDKQAHQLTRQLYKLRPDIFIARHNGMAVLGAKLGIPTFFVGSEHIGIAYDGLLNYGQEIINTVTNRTFVKNLAQYVRLPYKEKWLHQETCAL